MIDIFISGIGTLIFSPLFIVVSLAIKFESRGNILFRQERVGHNGKMFKVLKFRSMKSNSDKIGLLTVGDDNRITRVGKFIRKTKIDELPQLINVFKGEMSLVGPRPEVPKYVEMYNNIQRKVLTVRPGITDLASIKYFEESRLLGEAIDPEKTYIERIMPDKLMLNLEYIENMNLSTDVKIIFRTIGRILA